MQRSLSSLAMFGLAAAAAIACGADHSGGSRAGGMAGAAPTSGTGAAPQSTAGATSGGASGSGGAPGTSGASPTGGSPAGAAGASLGGAGATNTAGAPVGGTSAGTNAGGAGGSTTGGSSNGGSSNGGRGGGAGESGAGGASGAGGMGDRCDVAKLDTENPPRALSLSGNLVTHDPVVIFAHGQYYMFHTGDGIGAKTSTDLREWKAEPVVFKSNPSWIADKVPGVTNLWAPDISYFGGQYHLYYSASTFGSNRSCIGHATRAQLNSGSWTDHGPVVCSNEPGGSKDDWNAIDPNVVIDREGTPWLSFGSFWGGLKMIRLDESGARVGTELHAIAARPNAGGALEAPFIVWRCGYYYLFASFDSCCRGADSTYKTMVGRSTSVTGPYTDAGGVSMMNGGGTLILQGGTRWRGPGHNAVLFTETAAYNVYHAYDANNAGSPTLRISELAWDAEGWPVSGGP